MWWLGCRSELLIKRGSEDPELNGVAAGAVDALKLSFFANTSLIKRRREALRPKMDKRLAGTVLGGDITGKGLFGDEAADKVAEAQKADKFVRDLMGLNKRQAPHGRGRPRSDGPSNFAARGRGRARQDYQRPGFPQAQHQKSWPPVYGQRRQAHSQQHYKPPAALGAPEQSPRGRK